eukprot:2119936-Amphidinium_carterae.1
MVCTQLSPCCDNVTSSHLSFCVPHNQWYQLAGIARNYYYTWHQIFSICIDEISFLYVLILDPPRTLLKLRKNTHTHTEWTPCEPARSFAKFHALHWAYSQEWP